jgi:hypothetical protein
MTNMNRVLCCDEFVHPTDRTVTVTGASSILILSNFSFHYNCLGRCNGRKTKHVATNPHTSLINHLNTKPRLLYLKAQFVPRSKHFSTRL